MSSPHLPTLVTSDGSRSTKVQRLSQLDVSTMHATMRRNTQKEEVTLAYVEHFGSQFRELYPERRPLLLSPRNEAGVAKFVCTSLRPSPPPTKELYEARACARFLACHLTYEPLDPPGALPAVLPSPLFTMQSRAGDSFDFALTLASLLLGAGYDAYVAVGTAPAWVALKHEDKTVCQWFTPPEDAVDRSTHCSHAALGLLPPPTAAAHAPPPAPLATTSSSSSSSSNKYRLPSLVKPVSEVERKAAEAASAALAAAKAAQVAATHAPIVYPTQEEELRALQAGLPIPAPRVVVPTTLTAHFTPTPDPLPSTTTTLTSPHLHAWVVVLGGQRGVEDAFHLEPSTGAFYTPDTAPYLELDALFNGRNYWVNMQGTPFLPRQVIGAAALGDPLPQALSHYLLSGTSGGDTTTTTPGVLARGAMLDLLSMPAGAEAVAAVTAHPELLSPFTAISQAVAAAERAGLGDALSIPDSVDFHLLPGAPQLKGPGTARALAEPLGASKKPSGGATAGAGAGASQVAAPTPSDSSSSLPAEGGGGEGSSSSSSSSSSIEGSPQGAGAAGGEGEGGGESKVVGGDGEGGGGGANTSVGGEQGEEATTTSPSRPSSSTSSLRPSRQGNPRPGARGGGSRGEGRGGGGRTGSSGTAGGLDRVGKTGWRSLLLRSMEGEAQRDAAGMLIASGAYVSGGGGGGKPLVPIPKLRYKLSAGEDWEFVMLTPGGGAGEEEGDENGGEGGMMGGELGFGGGGGGMDAAFDFGGGGGGSSSSKGGLGGGVAGGGGGVGGGKREGGEEEGEEGGGAGKGEDGGEPSTSSDLNPSSTGGGDGASSLSSSSSSTAPPPPPLVPPPAIKNYKLERYGEHILDLPSPWCPQLLLSRPDIPFMLAPHGHFLSKEYHRSRLEVATARRHATGLTSRFTVFSDVPRTLPTTVTEAFSHRVDGLYKRVRRWDSGVVEEHYHRGGEGVHGAGARAGLACAVTYSVGGKRDLYFYEGGRVDCLLRRCEVVGVKIQEWYGKDSPRLLAYRGVKFFKGGGGGEKEGGGAASSLTSNSNAAVLMPSSSRGGNSPRRAALATPGGRSPMAVGMVVNTPGGGLATPGAANSSRLLLRSSRTGGGGASGFVSAQYSFAVVPNGKELGVEKMSEKFRLPPPPTPKVAPSTAAAAPGAGESDLSGEAVDSPDSFFPTNAPSKVKFCVSKGEIVVTYFSPPGRLTKTVHSFNKATGAVLLLSHVNPAALSRAGGPGAVLDKALHPTTFSSDALLQQLAQQERHCALAAKAMARGTSELLEGMRAEAARPVLEHSVFDVAQERWLSGKPIGEGAEEDTKVHDDNNPTDFILPLLIAMKVADVNNPTVLEATTVDSEVKVLYEKRLKARLAALKAKKQREVEKLVEAQHTHLRNRNPTDQQQRDYLAAVEGFNFRIGVLDDRIRDETVAMPVKVATFGEKLRKDKRLMCIYSPIEYADLLRREGLL